MAKLLFKLHNVPTDEAEEVRALLREHQIDTYETHAGFWGLGVAAIWLPDSGQLEEARALIDEYQARRTSEQRREYRKREALGEVPTLGQRLAHSPLRFLAMVVAILVVLGISIVPFWGMLSSTP